VKRGVVWICSAAFIVCVSLWSVWPVVKNAKTSFVFGEEDVLITWILGQTIQKVPHQLGEIFQGNIFYPFKNTFGYSVLLVPSALISYIPVKLTGNYILAFNFALVLGQISTMLIVFLLFYQLVKSQLAAILGTVVLTLSQIRMSYFVHLQMWTMQWWLVSVLMLWKFRQNSKVKYLYLASLFVAIQVWESLLPVFFVGMIGAILFIGKLKLLKQYIKHVVASAVLILFLTLPVLITYYTVSRDFNYVRPIREAAHFSMSLDGLWHSNIFSLPLFGLFALSILMILKKYVGKDRNIKWFLAIVLSGYIMALGPVAKWGGKTIKFFEKIFIPLPYGILYYLVPGFKALRTPIRWTWLWAFGASAVIAIAFAKYKSKYKNTLIILAIIIALVGGKTITEVKKPLLLSKYPKVYLWLKDQSGEVVVELPMYTWGVGDKYIQEYYRMFYSLEHGKKLVNGASGFIPPKRERLIARMWKNYPSRELEDELIEIGVDYVIVHKDEYDKLKLSEIINWAGKREVWENEKSIVYRLN
jgi:hypothetical protein